MSGLFDGLHFARPEWLWALWSVPLVALWRWRRRRDKDLWRDVVDAHLLPHLIERRVGRRDLLPLAGWVLAAACAALALAGPGWRQVPAPLHAVATAPLVVVVDLSTAATAGDLPPTRLAQMRAKLAVLFATRTAGETGLLAFADDAFTVAPLTGDATNLALYLDALSPDVMPRDGQRADRGIEQATRLMRQRGAVHGDILLLTDHADGAARSEAATALRMGYRVSVLGLGTAQGAAHRDADGGLMHARLDEASLQALADAGGGRYQRLSGDDADLRGLDVLGGDGGHAPQREESAAGAGGATHWADQGYWFVLPVLLLVLLAFRRNGGLVVLACLALAPMLPAHAQAARPEGTPWQRADQVAHDRMLDAAHAYRAGRYADAAKSWAALPGADAAYNRANALAKQGELDAAIDAYDEALHQQPGMADAEANRAAVEAARRRRPPPGPGEDPRAPPRDRTQANGRPTPGSGEPMPGDGATGRDTPPPAVSPPGEAEAQAQDDRSPSSAADQRQADADQRDRMQRALDASPDADADSGREAGSEAPADAAETERRQANDAWLRRVPDDPGGLLRAKFRLEHERRRREGE